MAKGKKKPKAGSYEFGQQAQERKDKLDLGVMFPHQELTDLQKQQLRVLQTKRARKARD